MNALYLFRGEAMKLPHEPFVVVPDISQVFSPRSKRVETYPTETTCPGCGAEFQNGVCSNCPPTSDMIGGVNTRYKFCSLCGGHTEHDSRGWCTECPKRRAREAEAGNNLTVTHQKQSGEP